MASKTRGTKSTKRASKRSGSKTVQPLETDADDGDFGGAAAHAPAAAGEAPLRRKRSTPADKPAAGEAAGARAQAKRRATAPSTPSAPTARSDEDSSTQSAAEIVWDDEDEEEDEEEDRGESSRGTVLDVGSTLPSLPAYAAAPSSSSVPAVRAREGLTRAGALERFLAEMGRYPLLTADEENKLTMDYYERKDPVAARKLVVHNLRLVVKMAYKYRRAWANVLDLIQEGNLGLVEAVDRFDPFKGAKFSTYATFWIRAYMLRYLLEHSRMVRISRTRVGRKLFFRLTKEREKLRAQGVEPGPKLLAERLGVGQNELEEVVRHMDQSEVRLDAPLYSDESGGTMLDALTGDEASPEAITYRREFENEVSTALESFATTLADPREVAAWKEHLMAEDPVSLSELGARFGVTKQRMGQIVTGLRKRLKVHLTNKLGPDVQLGFSLDAE
jgi:RNA polymerase sigma-32 factor